MVGVFGVGRERGAGPSQPLTSPKRLFWVSVRCGAIPPPRVQQCQRGHGHAEREAEGGEPNSSRRGPRGRCPDVPHYVLGVDRSPPPRVPHERHTAQ